MATKRKKAAEAEATAIQEPEQQVRRKARPDPSAVAQSFPYDPAAPYARAPELGGTNQTLAGVEGGAGGAGTTAAAPDVVAGGVGGAGTATGTTATGGGTATTGTPTV